MNTADTLLNERTNEFTGQTAPVSETYNAPQDPSLRDCVERAVSNYFQHLEE